MIKLAPLSVGISSVKATNTFWVLSLTPVVDFPQYSLVLVV